MQLQQMQDQISRQQGIIEELQNDVARMKQENPERYRIWTAASTAVSHLPRLPRILPPVAPPMPPPVPLLAPRPNNRPPAANQVIRLKRSSITMQLST